MAINDRTLIVDLLEETIEASLPCMGGGMESCSTLGRAWQLMKKHEFDVGVMIMDTPSLNQLHDIETLINEFATRWIALTTANTQESSPACRIIARLFFGYHVLPVTPEAIEDEIHRIAALARLERREDDIPDDPVHRECHMVGTSSIMKRLYRTIHKVAAVDAPVFIQGESGTGKELTARAIHQGSARAHRPFSAVNCGALPTNLIQSELFGHEKGAFTGASQRKIGIIEGTKGGTLFLDEIGDLPLELQVNLLRFLENRTIQRVGSHQDIAVDVRVLAATHVDLEKAVEDGKFREDLFHRLNVLQIRMPPLRDRGEDIEILARYFFDAFSCEKSTQVKGFTRESLTMMRLYDWPGNIRELINRVRRAMVMCEHALIRPADLGLERRSSRSRYADSLEEARDMAERSVVMAALARNTFNVQHAAKELGISRVTLYRLMEKHGIQRRHPEGDGASGGADSLHASKVIRFSGR
ncbi:sigma-54 interaction domain-containing protein [Halomonas koreensis]|uniref:Sigma-54 dependent transcriptional regulator n=1 Tax=Halomonas koreensis TaxID=245385 RepID=A0ABU1G294_9GAMM|nr:sigma-54 dependent transcriptional regulator [Halomonas koreensis]MDR5866554.1 sigma-54 dependent transcriptional regulator [Halomonas koreensis]